MRRGSDGGDLGMGDPRHRPLLTFGHLRSGWRRRGLGMLSKESFAFFVAGLVLASAVRGGRRAWRGMAIFGTIALVIACLVPLRALDDHALGGEVLGSSGTFSRANVFPGVAPRLWQHSSGILGILELAAVPSLCVFSAVGTSATIVGLSAGVRLATAPRARARGARLVGGTRDLRTRRPLQPADDRVPRSLRGRLDTTAAATAAGWDGNGSRAHRPRQLAGYRLRDRSACDERSHQRCLRAGAGTLTLCSTTACGWAGRRATAMRSDCYERCDATASRARLVLRNRRRSRILRPRAGRRWRGSPAWLCRLAISNLTGQAATRRLSPWGTTAGSSAPACSCETAQAFGYASAAPEASQLGATARLGGVETRSRRAACAADASGGPPAARPRRRARSALR